ncbi:MAG: transposase [Bdellovibrionaceae bacterium]|nr:transposase [Pseudobdellovibrionaceae bacterium]
MKKRFTEEQIVKAISRLRNGTPVKELGRELGVTTTTLYAWKKKYNDMSVSEAKRLRELEQENARLKRLVADQALNIEVLKDINSKKW